MRYAFVVAVVVLFQCPQVQASWELTYDDNLDMYAVLSDKIAVRTVQDKIVKTHMLIIFMCYPAKSEGLAMLFTDVPRFSNKRVNDLGESRSFGIMTALHRKGEDKPKLGYPEVKQNKKAPKIVFFDISFFQEMRRYDVLSIGFGWKERNHVDGVSAHVSLEGSSALINEAQRKCGSP